MSEYEEKIKFVESSLELEGIILSAHEKQTMMDCLRGKTSFSDAVKMTLAKYKKASA